MANLDLRAYSYVIAWRSAVGKWDSSVKTGDAPSSSSYITWWKISNPHQTDSISALEVKGGGFHMQPSKDIRFTARRLHIMVSCVSVLSSVSFYTLKTGMLREGFGENTLLCSPTPSACTVRHTGFLNFLAAQLLRSFSEHIVLPKFSASQAWQPLPSSWQLLFYSTLAK